MKQLRKRFKVTIVDEYNTSKKCNTCMEDLSTYIKKNDKHSYRRLRCTNCNLFVNRDVNGAKNILLAGTSSERPSKLKRKNSDSDDDFLPAKRPKRQVGAWRSSRSPLSGNI